LFRPPASTIGNLSAKKPSTYGSVSTISVDPKSPHSLPPGEILKDEFLDPPGVSPSTLAELSEIPVQRVPQLVEGVPGCPRKRPGCCRRRSTRSRTSGSTSRISPRAGQRGHPTHCKQPTEFSGFSAGAVDVPRRAGVSRRGGLGLGAQRGGAESADGLRRGHGGVGLPFRSPRSPRRSPRRDTPARPASATPMLSPAPTRHAHPTPRRRAPPWPSPAQAAACARCRRG